MASNKNKQVVRIIFLVLTLGAFVGLYMYNQSINSKEVIIDDAKVTLQKFSNQELDTAVLDDEKFKELKPIPIKEISDKEGDFGGELTEEEKNQLKMMARYSNPFLPFN